MTLILGDISAYHQVFSIKNLGQWTVLSDSFTLVIATAPREQTLALSSFPMQIVRGCLIITSLIGGGWVSVFFGMLHDGKQIGGGVRVTS